MAKMNKTIGLAAAFTAIITGAVLASEPFLPKKESGFKRIDTNSNGKIELAELGPVATKRLARLDVNGDNEVTADEINITLTNAIAKRRERMLQLMDQDKNGKVTQVELDKLVESMFNSADSDDDGALTIAETQAFKRGLWRKEFLDKSAN